mgnify:CR=1 FL=1
MGCGGKGLGIRGVFVPWGGYIVYSTWVRNLVPTIRVGKLFVKPHSPGHSPGDIIVNLTYICYYFIYLIV